MSDNLKTIKSFFGTAVRLLDCKMYDYLKGELILAKNTLKRISLQEKTEQTRIESAICQLEVLKEYPVPRHLKDSMNELAGKDCKPHLQHAESLFLKMTSEVSTKYLKHIAKTGFSTENMLAFFTVLSAVSPAFDFKGNKVTPVLNDLCKQFLANPGGIIQAAKRVPEALKNLQLDFDLEHKVRRFYSKLSSCDKIKKFVKDSLKLAKAYRTLRGVKKPKKKKAVVEKPKVKKEMSQSKLQISVLASVNINGCLSSRKDDAGFSVDLSKECLVDDMEKDSLCIDEDDLNGGISVDELMSPEMIGEAKKADTGDKQMLSDTEGDIGDDRNRMCRTSLLQNFFNKQRASTESLVTEEGRDNLKDSNRGILKGLTMKKKSRSQSRSSFKF